MAKVLLVDDDPFIIDMYSLKLKEEHFEVEIASDGRKALEMIKMGKYAVVLLDIVLPILDGFEILGILQRERVAHAPIILLTNLGQKEDVDRGRMLGAVGYIIKAHFTPGEVVEKMKQAIGQQ